MDENQGQGQGPATEQQIFDKLLSKMEPPSQPETPEEVSETVDEGEAIEPETETGEESVDPETVEEEPAEYIKLTVDGKEEAYTKNEVVELAQKGKDYTYKTEKLAQERRAFEQQVQMQTVQLQIQQQVAIEAAQVQLLDQNLKQWEAVDWKALESNDPYEYVKLKEQYRDLKDSRNELVQRVEFAKQQAAIAYQQHRAKQLEEGQAELKRSIKDWSPEKGQVLMRYIMDQGASESEASNITAPWAVKLHNKAYLYDQLQSKKPGIEKKVQGVPKVITPGNQAKTDKQTELKKAIKSARDPQVKTKLIQQMLMSRIK